MALYNEGKRRDEERRAAYRHSGTDHSAMHKFAGGKIQEAFQLKEMGEAGTGKTVISVELLRRLEVGGHAAACHFFRHDDATTSNPLRS